jgi:hypothetical protein
MAFLTKKAMLPFFIIFSCLIAAQKPDSLYNKQEQEDIKYPQLQIKGLFQARYLVGMSKDVDVNGLHHSDHTGTDNNFMIKYMRVQMRAQISKRTEVVVLPILQILKTILNQGYSKMHT